MEKYFASTLPFDVDAPVAVTQEAIMQTLKSAANVLRKTLPAPCFTIVKPLLLLRLPLPQTAVQDKLSVLSVERRGEMLDA